MPIKLLYIASSYVHWIFNEISPKRFRYVHEQESAFYPMYLAQFVVGVLVICLTVVELTLVRQYFIFHPVLNWLISFPRIRVGLN